MAYFESTKDKKFTPIDVSSEFSTTGAQATIIALEVYKSGNVMQGYFRFKAPSSAATNNPTICTFPTKYNPLNGHGVQGCAQNTWSVNKCCGVSVGGGIVNIAATSYEANASYVFTATWLIAD